MALGENPGALTAHFPHLRRRCLVSSAGWSASALARCSYELELLTLPLPSPSSLPTMPAGVPMFTYLKMLTASLLAMCAGAEVVHRYYRPELTIPEIPPKPGELKTELLGLKERKHKPQVSQQEELK